MIPILFEPKATDFQTNGVGRLSDTISCLVTEERNGEYELEMQYPITGEHYKEIKMASLILALPGDGRETQPFAIYKITKPLNGIATMYARHKSYQLSYIPCSPFSASNVVGALDGLKEYAVEECPFTFWTDKTTEGTFEVSVPVSIRSRLGGAQGSILDVYGGEFEFDRNTVRLLNNRGSDKGVVLKYGKNMTDLVQEENISNTITGIYPYWADSEGNLVELPEKVLSSENAQNFPYPRTVPMDFSQEFEGQPSVEELRIKAEKYIFDNDIGVPVTSISVSFEALWQTEEYKDIAPLEHVKLCDTITVDYETLGVKAKAKIIKTTFDVLKEKYTNIEVGEARSTLAGTIVEQQRALSEKPSRSFLETAVLNATNWITGTNGGYVVMHKDANGQPYEILIMDSPDINTAKRVWRWNQGGLGYSSSGYSGPYTAAITQDGAIVADFITTGTMKANLIKGGSLNLGGVENGNGVCVVLDANGAAIVTINKDGIVVNGQNASTSNIVYNYGKSKLQFNGENISGYYNGSRRFIIQATEDGGAAFDGHLECAGNMYVQGNLIVDGTITN